MNYPQVVEWLYSQLANYYQQGSTAYKPGLDSISHLLSQLGNPEHKFKSIHIAGTNGKGSTAHMLAAMAIENGYKVGLFTSPHIKDFRERIKINGQLIDEKFVVDFVSKHKYLLQRLQPSFFEITTAMAFVAFATQECDYAIIETGLGGRLDATNVLSPEISAITNIGLDHTEFLGETLDKIAFEKAGIIKEHTPVVIGEILPETKPVFDSKIKQQRAILYQPIYESFELDILGEYQQKNAALAWKILQVLKEKGHFFDDKKSRVALTRVTTLTNFKGRLTQIGTNPLIIADASHNIQGIETLLSEIKRIPHSHLHCIYASVNDKKYEESMRFFPKSATYYLTEFDSQRSVSREVLAEIADTISLQYSTYKNIDLALKSAKAKASADDLVIVFGSFYLLEPLFS